MDTIVCNEFALLFFGMVQQEHQQKIHYVDSMYFVEQVHTSIMRK